MTTHRPNVGPLLGRRHRRWASSGSMCRVFWVVHATYEFVIQLYDSVTINYCMKVEMVDLM